MEPRRRTRPLVPVWRRREDGAVAVEFALVSVVLITLVFGIMQYGWYFFSAQSASSAAREAARRLVVGDCTGAGEAENFAQSQASLASLQLDWGSEANPTANTMTGMNVGDIVVVTVTADGEIIGFLPMPNGGQVTRVVKARLEDKVAGSGGC